MTVIAVRRGMCAVAILLVQGCVSLLPPDNEPISVIHEKQGYRQNNPVRKPVGEHQVILAFSGGGTRAAALSYGVMQVLRDTPVHTSTGPVRLLDEVDVISSVSGGSFTAAYYGLYGDGLFTDYEDDFLRKSVQSSLINNLLSPSYWFHAMFSGVNRTDMAVDYYNRTIFRDATFADIPLDKRPFIEINATDLANGAHFSFTQSFFDLFCTDLSSYPVARAVTASSGVPMMFPPVTLKNHADSCDISTTYLGKLINGNKAVDNARKQALVDSLGSYRDAESHPYIHLVDGGVSDNLGLRAVMDRNELMGVDINRWFRESPVRDVLVILVNAEVKPEKTIDRTYQSPSMLQTAGSLTDALISRYTVETRALVRAQMRDYEKLAQEAGYDVRFYFVEINFSALDSPGLQKYFNNLPTTLELSNEEIDQLISAGKGLLQRSSEFQEFLQRDRSMSQEKQLSHAPR